MAIDDIKSRLLGKHVQIHKLDFEILEEDDTLKIIPHAEQETAVKTLPVTRVELVKNDSKTNIKIRCKIREIDSGGPYLLVSFSLFMFIGSIVAFLGTGGKGEYASLIYTMLAISVGMFTIFWIRMEQGYFDYVRKIREYVKKQCAV
ncbi:MAG: hypothetical protein WCG87_11020 [Bacteroidota bacterium]